ncbi:MAG: hypothetical protein K6D54_05705 [Bacteroidales bacterium]|nr:hypothetical protein [Bacteroidales bacterium]
MKRLFMMAAVSALALVSCQKDLGFEEKNAEERQPEESSVVFTATTEGSDTRTALSENEGRYNVVWRSGDRITIADGSVTPNVGEYSTTSETTSATFTKESGADPAATPYKAWYPATLYNAGAPTLPATQDYVAGNISGMPMYAESSTTALSFKNLCGIIRLNVSTTISGKKVRRIILAADQGMSGAISNAGSLEGSGYAAAVSGTAGVTLDCGEGGVSISGSATPFHIAVPANTYTTLKITVVTTDGEVQTRTSNKGIGVERSKITDITLGFGSLAATTGRAAITGGSSQEWVQLWAGGPKWAKFNVGSTITSYAGVTKYINPGVIGGYYSFKGRYDSGADANGTSDTATYHWGANWATPTGAQEQALLDNCIWTYCDGASVQYEPGCTLAGWIVSGRDAGYTENSIFLPFSGIRDQNNRERETVGTRGCYWSSNSGGYGAYFLDSTSGSHSYVSANAPHGLSVRAICVNDYEDLSASESANCYLVPSSGRYMFRATVKGNGAANLAGISKDTDVATINSASLVWATFNTTVAPAENELIKNISYSNGYVYFSTGSTYKEGNALVAIKDASDNILWSWHLWFESDNMVTQAQTYPGSGYVVMDRNLGALTNCYAADNALDFGFAYQNGRKDPFMMSATRTSYTALGVLGTYTSSDGSSSVASSILRPTVVFGTDSWGGSPDYWTASDKTIFDPCPPGWRVGPNNLWSASGFNSTTFVPKDGAWDTYHGWVFNGEAWFPATGDRWGSNHNNTGSLVRVWARGGGNALAAGNGGTPTLGDGSNPGHGYSVRCVKE